MQTYSSFRAYTGECDVITLIAACLLAFLWVCHLHAGHPRCAAGPQHVTDTAVPHRPDRASGAGKVRKGYILCMLMSSNEAHASLQVAGLLTAAEQAGETVPLAERERGRERQGEKNI